MAAIERFMLRDQTLWLTAERCIYWENASALILSDLHLGKTGHFRKAGIAVPQDIFKKDLQRLFAQIQYFNPSQLLIVGDLFHSYANKELEMFLKWRKDRPEVSIKLIKGNHDILSKKTYAEMGIEVSDIHLNIEPFCFTHDINSVCDGQGQNNYIFSGHIHPGVKLSGGGKQSILMPCYYFNYKYAVLPAFSLFTGASKMKVVDGDTIYGLLEKQVLKIS